MTKADDPVVSTKVISLYLNPAEREPTADRAVRRPALRGEPAIGYRRQEEVRRPPQYGVTLNPDKAATLTLGADDQVIVLAGT